MFPQRSVLWRRGLVLLLPVLFVSCLTIEENYRFKKDGSGELEYVVDMSALGELLKSLEALGDGKKEQSAEGPMDLKSDMDRLKKIPGISKVKLNTKEKYVQKLSFRFKDLSALNAALNELMPDSTGVPHAFFRWEGGTLVRTNNRHAVELGMDQSKDAEADSTDPTAFLQSMRYKYSFAFADPIRETGTAEGVNVERPDGMSMKLDTDWSVIMSDPGALDLRITLDK